MTTPRAWWLVIQGRLKCRLLRRHTWRVRVSHGYRVAFCNRCWGFEIQRLPEVPA